jgi:hypothetical protein
MLASALNENLESLQRSSSIYVHKKVLTFPDGLSKENWMGSIPDCSDRGCFTALFHTPKGGRRPWVALFNTWTRTWVGDHDWDQRDWHAWGCAVIPSSGNKPRQLLLYDCDPVQIDPKRQADHFILSLQAKFIKLAQENGRFEFWYNQDTTKSNRDLCLLHSWDWVTSIATFGEEAWKGDNDPRGIGFEKLKKL